LSPQTPTAEKPTPEATGMSKKQQKEAAEALAKQQADEVLAATMEEEGVRLPEGMTVQTWRNRLAELQQVGISIGGRVKSAVKSLSERRAELADNLIDIRELVILPIGVPDFAGATTTYKEAVKPITGAAFYEAGGDTETQAYNALNKAAQRRLPVRVGLWTRTARGIDLPDSEVERIVKMGLAAAVEAGKEGADEKLVEFVNAVNEVYAMQWAGEEERPRNYPLSPFEARPSRTRTTPTGTEAQAAEVYKASQQFQTAVEKNLITLDEWTNLLVSSADALVDRVSGNEPHYGDGGKPTTSANLKRAISLLQLADMRVEGLTWGKAEAKLYDEVKVK